MWCGGHVELVFCLCVCVRGGVGSRGCVGHKVVLRVGHAMQMIPVEVQVAQRWPREQVKP